jgi:mRNA interferase MazF
LPISEAGFARHDVIVVPFPFTELPVMKRRPAVVLSNAGWAAASGHLLCAMVTSAAQSAWPGDVAVQDLAAAGLISACVVRLKLFTLPAALVIRRAGRLAATDSTKVTASLRMLLKH